METKQLNPKLNHYLKSLEQEFKQISETRKEQLQELSNYINETLTSGQTANLIFICTHNSRRSHMSQLWAQAAAAYYGFTKVHTFSAGTESTAFYPSAIKAMQEAGFKITKIKEGKNPLYEAQYSQEKPALKVWSKTISDESNPKENFCAVMTCTHADENCPVVQGTDKRIALPFEDPKAFDGTPQESEKYSERSRQIAREMLYAFSLIKTF